MKNYSSEIRTEAQKLFARNFNCLSFDLLKKAVGEDAILDYIKRPSNEVLRKEAEGNLGDWDKMTEEERKEATETYFLESEHYPIWLTIFEAKNNFISERIMKQIDELYDLGIGVIAPTAWTKSCLFIAGTGYSFYDAHWIPLFIHWGWIDEKKFEAKEKRNKIKLLDWNEFGDILEKLAENKDQAISRNAKGLLKALKL